MIETLLAALAEVPGALLVIVLLAGPTAAWLVIRVLNAPVRQPAGATRTGLLWVCASCRSANDASRDRCYRCGVAADVDALEVITPDVDPRSALRPVMSQGLDLGGRAPVAVGPGKGSPAPEPEPQPGPGQVGERAHDPEPVPARVPVMALDDAPVNVRVEVPRPASPRRITVAVGQARSLGDADPTGPDSARSEPASTS